MSRCFVFRHFLTCQDEQVSPSVCMHACVALCIIRITDICINLTACYTCTTGLSALPDICAQTQGRAHILGKAQVPVV